MQEIEYAVAAAIEAGDEVRPGNWTLRRVRGFERREAALLGDTRQVREAALLDELGCELVVHAVEAEDDHALTWRLGARRRCYQRAGDNRDRRCRKCQQADGTEQSPSTRSEGHGALSPAFESVKAFPSI